MRPLYNSTLVIQRDEDKKKDESVLSEADLKNYVPYLNLVKERDRLQAEWFKDLKNLKQLNLLKDLDNKEFSLQKD